MPDIQQIVIWGAGGHAKVVAAVIRRSSNFDIVGLLDDQSPERVGQAYCGEKVLGGSAYLKKQRNDGVGLLAIAIGDNASRMGNAKVASELGFTFPTLIDPSAVVADDAQLGNGVIVAAGAIINPAAQVGDLAIVNSGSIIEHDCRIAEGVHIAPGAILAGHVTVGRGTFIGAGAAIRDRVNIGHGSVIGAGAVVVSNIPDNVVAYGVPAKIFGNKGLE